MNLFLSHASEDKAFAGPLAAKLQKSHNVWYDDYVLTVGSSIFESVSRGLRECDYGIAVLSPHFFVKKWTRAELTGLFALEGALRKLILPVWLDVTAADVTQFSPILADRRAAMASDGVTAVANALNAAIYASAEARKQETGSSPLERIRQLNNATAERLRSRTLLDSAEGIRLACQAMHLTMEAAEAATGEFVTNAAALGLSWEKGAVAANAWYLNIYAPGHPFKGRLIGRIDWAQPGRDTAAADTITITICRFFGGSRSTDVLKEREYAPFITEADEIVWCDDKVRSDAATVIHGLHSDFAMQLEQDLDFESDQRHS